MPRLTLSLALLGLATQAGAQTDGYALRPLGCAYDMAALSLFHVNNRTGQSAWLGRISDTTLVAISAGRFVDPSSAHGPAAGPACRDLSAGLLGDLVRFADSVGWRWNAAGLLDVFAPANLATSGDLP